MANIPKVTGISPKEGLPRTKLTIRGENLGIDQDDVISVKICEIECNIFTDWISPQKIIIRSPHTNGTGDVIVTTKRGGVGISMIKFRAYEEPVGLTTPSGVWVDESESGQFDYRRSTSPSIVFNDFGMDNSSLPLSSRASFDKPISSLYSDLAPGNVSYSDILSESFTPSVYLVENHNDASFQDLKAFYRIQQEKCNSESKNTLNSNAFLKANVLSIIDCLNALNAFYLAYKKDKQEMGSELTLKIDDCIKVASSEAHSIFDNIISRKDKSDSTRNALNVLQRYQKNIDELKKLIKYLSTLEVGTDPAWETIQMIKSTLFNKISECRKKFLTPGNKPVNTNESITDHIEPPPEVKFIDEVSKIFSVVFTDLFKLGCAYLNGDLYAKDLNNTVKHKSEIFEKEIINESINLLCSEFRSIILPESNYSLNQSKNESNENLVIWLPYCLRCSVNCYSNLMALDFSSVHLQNMNILRPLQSFIFDLRLHTMTCLFNQASQEIKGFSSKEAWHIQLDDIYGVRTNLPLLFETKVIETLQLIRDSVIQIRNSDEVDIFSQINVKGSVKQLAQNLINSFLTALEKSVANPGLSNSNITEDNRSLIVLCNCSYTSNYVLPKLYEAFDKYGYPDMSQVIQLTQKKFKELENRLLELFIEKKRDSVIGIIEPSMYLFDPNWTSAREMPKEVSYYVKETILSLIFVQAEIYQITPQLVNKTMFIILLATIDEIERLYESCINKISDAARVQMLIDINAIDNVLRNTGKKYYPKLKRKIENCRAICNASVQDQTIRKYWLISAPGEKTCQQTWDTLNNTLGKHGSDFCKSSRFHIPDLKVGTLDQLVGLSDDLNKLDTYVESVSRKLAQAIGDILEKGQPLNEQLQANGQDLPSYITKFQWDSAKFPVKQSLKSLQEIINKQIGQIDSDLKTKTATFNNLKNTLQSLERRQTGSLLVRNLTELVKKEHFVLGSEYLTTLMVVVPKSFYKDWLAKYEKLTDMIVPRSTTLVFEDNDHGLFNVTLFNKVIEEFKIKARENKFIVRDFTYNEDDINAGKNEIARLESDLKKQYHLLMRWLKVHFSESVIAWIHIKVLRLFVESVLRYGLPVNFVAALLLPPKKNQRRIREVLNQLYSHLDTSISQGPIEDIPGFNIGQQEYYPYVSFKMNIDFVTQK
ncbi:Exocyst complex component 2 [Blomia tropicalis]|nr:Exocyst complex component 2 [Blomia tropicalis]